MQHTIFALFLSHIICLNKTEVNRERTDSLGLAHRVSISIHSHREVLWPYFSLYVLWAWVADSPAPPSHISFSVCSLSLLVPSPPLYLMHICNSTHTQVRGEGMRRDEESFLAASKFKDGLLPFPRQSLCRDTTIALTF